MPYCHNCGSKVDEDEKFCRSCGTAQRTTPTNSTNQHVSELKEDIKLAEEFLKPDSKPPQTNVTPVSMEKLNEFLESVPLENHTNEPLVPIHENIKLMKEFKKIVPEKLYNRIMEMYETSDPLIARTNAPELQRAIDQLTFIYKNYSKMVKSPFGTLPYEKILWIYEETKGIFKKEVSKTWAITNLRVYENDHETGLNFAKGLLLSDTQVVNLVRNSRENRIGAYTADAAAYGFDATTQRGDYSGDLVFFFQGSETFRLTGITDPDGVLRVVENAKKQQRAALDS